jgi:hypothetical protein
MKDIPIYDRSNIDKDKLNTIVNQLANEAVNKIEIEIDKAANKEVNEFATKIDEAAKEKVNEIEIEIGKEFEKLPEDFEQARTQVLIESLFNSLSNENDKNRGVIELHCAWQKMKGKNSDDIAKGLLALINLTTIAVLLDDDVRFQLINDSVKFTSKLEYLYVTSYLEITNERIGSGKAPNERDNEVKPLESLSTLVNNNLTELLNNYPPLKKIQRYAEIAALFRWSDEAVKKGKLGFVDLSELAAFPSNDRDNYPTIDVLKY